jgi:murein DD-endopeptidase MepM/ murein hydrolase activator NlpD
MNGIGNPVKQAYIRPFGSPSIYGDFRVTAPFGAIDADHKTPHMGVDIGDGRCGSPAIAMVTGKVSYAGGTFGIVRIIWDDDPSYEFAIAHCKLILVKVGDHVARGQQIASIGNTGVTACHGHLGCKHNGVEVDIWPLLDQNQEEGVLQGTNPRPLDNKKVSTSTGSVDGLRFRASPFVKSDNILAMLPNNTELHPDFIVDGTKVGATADPRWYGAWAATPKGREFGYVSVLFCSTPTAIESTGISQAKYDADIAAAKVAARAAGIQAARDDLKDTV